MPRPAAAAATGTATTTALAPAAHVYRAFTWPLARQFIELRAKLIELDSRGKWISKLPFPGKKMFGDSMAEAVVTERQTTLGRWLSTIADAKKARSRVACYRAITRAHSTPTAAPCTLRVPQATHRWPRAGRVTLSHATPRCGQGMFLVALSQFLADDGSGAWARPRPLRATEI